MFIISTNKLTNKYGDFAAVDNLTLTIERGEVFGLVGPNGAGKTTLLLMLATLLEPSAGEALVNGFDIVRERSKVRKSLGIVFQDPSSDDTLTGYENLKLHGMLYNMPSALREARIKEVLDLVELTGRQNDLVKRYSGGMRRRLELARGLMHHPKILFLDEPTLGLDPQSREHIWRYTERLAREEKMTIVITTHYMEEVERLCTRLAIIDAGKIVVLGTPAELKQVIGGDIVRVTAPKPDLEKLRALSFVKNAELNNGVVSLTVIDASRHLASILEMIGKVETVEVRVPTLNDVFLHYTGKDMRPASAEGGFAERAMHYRSR
jgi:ABC-2 type transport system ATP-binding protein